MFDQETGREEAVNAYDGANLVGAKRDRSALEGALDNQERAIELLDTSVSQLEAKLKPLLHEDDTDKSISETNPGTGSSILVRSINTRTYRTENIISRLNRLIRELEI